MTFIEKALLPLSRRHPALHEFLWFGMKQAWACLFGALLLAGILVTRLWYPDIPLARYDFLVFYAVGIQFALILLKFESWRELCMIFLFHLMVSPHAAFLYPHLRPPPPGGKTRRAGAGEDHSRESGLNDPHLIRLHKAFRDPIDLHQQLPRRT